MLYQGGISHKIDFDLLRYIVDKNPDVTFLFCGGNYINNEKQLKQWNIIIAKTNVVYYGQLHPDEVVKIAHKARIGIIPFVQNDWIKKRSFPLKAFEYLAAGLNVISVPIHSLSEYSEIIHFTSNKENFKDFIASLINTVFDNNSEVLLKSLSRQDYDNKFHEVLEIISNLTEEKNIGFIRYCTEIFLLSFIKGSKFILYRITKPIVLIDIWAQLKAVKQKK